jgi:uroporphyrinogen decarboxylase
MELKNDLFLRAIKGEEVERPPIWLMRQAGRILPEYRAVRSSVENFVALVKNPELCAEVTVQPIDALNVDAAILFSDILVIPEAMGLEYQLVEKVGPIFPKTIQSQADVDVLLSGQSAADRIDYVYDAIDSTLRRLENRVPLLGFAGAPWTLFAYMVEGSGSKTFSKAKRMLYKEPELSHKLMQKITDTVICYLKTKIKHGVSLVQVFDSWAGLLDVNLYRTFAIPYLKQIREALGDFPVTLFSKGAWFAFEDIQELDPTVMGVDWTISPEKARAILGNDQILQGNLDPCQLYADHESIAANTVDMLNTFGRNHIVNLGHGVYPDTPLDGVKHFVNTVLDYRYH